ncbi:hypothetical protein ONE63_007141 [Megalurothrips usitatus]|uniref:Cyclin-dependent kinase 20 n=1 Tax=Megalurothrips usitatus TaxID=439358 RepID=A0AAV7XV71_9NEOP|nr:hypothetical protein ONE63_007141 [Megalurothrips usitatus]
MENYTVTGHIGEGAHGLVLRGKHHPTGREVALKKVKVRRLEDGIPISILRESKILKTVDCRYIVKLLDFFPQGLGFVLVFELMPSGLWEMLHDIDNPITPAQGKSYMQMLLLGLNYLHKHHIMHRDLKPANLLISFEGELKIADLGQARLVWTENKSENRPYTHQVATRWYRAPELLYGAKFYSQAVDLWAVGCILAEIIMKSPLFPGETDIEQLAMVISSLGTPTEESWPGLTALPDYNKIIFPESRRVPWETLVPDCPPDALSLIQCFLLYNADKRISAQEALNHSYFFTPPLACPLSEMPKPKDGHRNKFKDKEVRADVPIEELFKHLADFVP